MPLFEDDTLEGAIRKATAGLGRQRKQEQRLPTSFGPYSVGDRISGTGGEGFSTMLEARNAVGQEFERQARRHFPIQTARYDNGSTEESDMIPELGTSIYAYEDSSGNVRYGFLDFSVGSASRSAGQASTNMPFRRSSVVAMIHAHWIDAQPSGHIDRRTRDLTPDSSLDMGAARQFRDQIGRNVEFYVYQWNGRWSPAY